MVCPPVQEIFCLLKLVNNLLIQANKHSFIITLQSQVRQNLLFITCSLVLPVACGQMGLIKLGRCPIFEY